MHFTLDALESTQHSAQGNVDRFCHMPLRPPEVRVGFGAKPQGLQFGKKYVAFGYADRFKSGFLGQTRGVDRSL